MKNVFLVLIVPLALFALCGCSQDDVFLKKNNVVGYPAGIEDYGQTLAEEFRLTVSNLHEMGIFYSDASLTPEFRAKFLNDWYMASPSKTRSGSLKEIDVWADTDKILEGYRSMTDIQKDFFERIISECESSATLVDMERRLRAVNEDIYARVPEIQRERLFIISATLYYLSVEVEQVKRNGRMFVGSVWNMPAIKTRSEDGSFGDKCRSFYSAVALAVGSVIESGLGREIVKSVTKAVAGAAGWVIVACSVVSGDTNRDECIEKYSDCIDAGGQWAQMGSGGAGKTMCAACLEYCRTQHIWDCPRPL